jgi:hypothetical protein
LVAKVAELSSALAEVQAASNAARPRDDEQDEEPTRKSKKARSDPANVSSKPRSGGG